MKFVQAFLFTLITMIITQAVCGMSCYNWTDVDVTLWTAIHNGYKEGVKILLEADPNGVYTKHLFSEPVFLVAAINSENINIVRLLVDKGFSVDLKKPGKITAFEYSLNHYLKLLKNLATAEISCKELYKARLAQAEEIVICLYVRSLNKRNRDFAKKVLSLTCEDVIRYQEQLIDEQQIQKDIIHLETHAGHVAIPLVDLASKAQTTLS